MTLVYEVTSRPDEYTHPVSLGLFFQWEDAMRRAQEERERYPNDSTEITTRCVK